MPWGISNNAPPIEKIKASIADELNGLNSVGEINYSTYSNLFDLMAAAIDQAYELGKAEAHTNPVANENGDN